MEQEAPIIRAPQHARNKLQPSSTMVLSRRNAIACGWLLHLCLDSSAFAPPSATDRSNPSLALVPVVVVGRIPTTVSSDLAARSFRTGFRLGSSNRDTSGISDSSDSKKEFWLQQKRLLLDLSDASNKSVRARQRERFAQQRLALVGDTFFLGFLVFCGLWSGLDNPFVALSYALGATLGAAYAYGLGKYVENLGGSAYDAEAGKGAGVGEARFAFLILLFVLVGKFRGAGLEVVPTIGGFFTYQIASLAQGLKPDVVDDE